MSLGGKVPLSAYFADLPRKKQIAATAFFEFEVLVADFVLVSVFVLSVITRLLTRGPDISLVSRLETSLVG